MKPSPTGRHGWHKGVTLVELVGVVAVLALLATLAADGLSGRIRDARRLAEQSNVEEILVTLRSETVRSRSLPGTENWPAFVASRLETSPGEVLTNKAGNPRVLVYDPGFRFGLDQAPASASSTLAQTSLGSTNLASPRVVLISSMGAPLPSLSTVSFEALWNCPSGSLPSGWPAWESSVEDLKIGRTDLRDLFHRVLLQNIDADLQAGMAVHNVGDVLNVAPEASVETWLIDGSMLFLRLPDGGIQTADLVRGEASYVFERGRWNRRISMGWTGQAGTVGALADLFVAMGIPSYPRTGWKGATPQAVLDEMYHFMVLYDRWAERGFPGEPGAGADQPDFRLLVESAQRLQTFSLDLILSN